MTPEIPQPSSRTEEWGVRMEWVVRGDVGEEIQVANKGVTRQRTGVRVRTGYSNKTVGGSTEGDRWEINAPAPVVPPPRLLLRIVGL